MVQTQKTHSPSSFGKRYIRLRPRDKRPMDRWRESSSQHAWDDPKLEEHIRTGGNVGCVLGKGLVVIDVDHMEHLSTGWSFSTELWHSIRPTYTVMTGSGCLHLYFRTLLTHKLILYDGETHLGEVLTGGQYVVCPPSIHPKTGMAYTVLNDLPLSYLPPESLVPLLERWIRRPQTTLTFPSPRPPVLDSRPPPTLAEVKSLEYRKRCLAVLEDPHPNHNQRVWLVGFLLNAIHLSVNEVTTIIATQGRWLDYEPAVTLKQVQSLAK